MSDLFPIYCRSCHKQIDASARVCPFCGEAQGLSGATPSPPAYTPGPSQQASQSATATQTSAGALDFCPYCQTQVTSGDIYCRACGHALVPGVRMSDSDVAQAYAISAVIAALLCASPAAVVLGLIAMVKGSRGLGCAAIVLFLMVSAVLAWMSFGAVHSLLPHALPRSLPGLGLPE
ncbi:MAG: zinc ribbon domain-containing protein [Armatimonadetes bacterium]|nr:zinc ribbon domain-containing protein [Armatimonadota bacterium]